MAKFLMTELILSGEVQSSRLGAGSGAANWWTTDAEVGKAVKLVAESRYDLCAAGDPIEAFVVSVEAARLDDFSFGSIRKGGRKEVTFDGLQATPGTGTVAIGDYVNTGTVVAKATSLGTTPVKVCKSTSQAVTHYLWRVISLGTAGTGAVGTVGVIEFVGK